MSRTLSAFIFVLAVTSPLASATQTGVSKAAHTTTATNFSGSWTGSITIPAVGKREKSPLQAVFKQAGFELTGTIGPGADTQAPIVNGRVETTKFGTVMTFDLPGQSFVMHFE